MAREFTAAALVTLPKLDARDAYVLATALVRAHDDWAAGAPADQRKALKGTLGKAFARMKERNEALMEAGKARLAAATPDEGVRAADRAEDNAWVALHDLLWAWLRLPETFPNVAVARELLQVLFKGEEKVGFITVDVMRELAEAEARLQLVADLDLEPRLAALGGADFLTHLRAVHARYADVVHRALQASGAEQPRIDGAFGDLLAAVRVYALKVAALADPDEPETDAVVDALLQPLAAWEKTRAPGDDAKAPPAPAPTPPAKPT